MTDDKLKQLILTYDTEMPASDIDYLMNLKDRDQVITTLLAKLMDREQKALEYDDELDEATHEEELDHFINSQNLKTSEVNPEDQAIHFKKYDSQSKD